MFSGWDTTGTLISNFEENLWDIDIKKVGVSHSHQKACICNWGRPEGVSSTGPKIKALAKNVKQAPAWQGNVKHAPCTARRNSFSDR